MIKITSEQIDYLTNILKEFPHKHEVLITAGLTVLSSLVKAVEILEDKDLSK